MFGEGVAGGRREEMGQWCGATGGGGRVEGVAGGGVEGVEVLQESVVDCGA